MEEHEVIELNEDESLDVVEELEMMRLMVCGEIKKLLKAGGMILIDLDNYMQLKKEIECKLSSLTGEAFIHSNDGPLPFNQNEARNLLAALNEANGNQAEAARILQMHRRSAIRHMQRHGLLKKEGK
jgi:transcriptional regulator with GAF, ATPase, and Fis domain